MKKFVFILAAFAAAFSFNSCQKEDRDRDSKPQGYKYTFNIADDDLKATLNSTGVAWESTDAVGMYLDGYTGYANVNTANSPTTVILYSPNVIPAHSYAYAYYPYDSANDDKTVNHIFLANIQKGGSASAMPLAGLPFEVETEAAAKERPNGVINFLNLGAVIDFRIFSDTYDDEVISYVTFTATSKKTLAGVNTDLAVSGDGYLDLTQVSLQDASSLDLSFGLGTDYDYAKVNDLSVAVADVKANATTPIYLVVAPGIYTGTITIGTDKATYTFNYTNKTLARNVVKRYNMDLDNASRVAEVIETVEALPYNESFATGIGEFSTDGEQVASTNVWQHSSNYMKASAYVSSTKYESESWLTSPWVDLRNVTHAYASFDHVHQYAGTASSELTFWVLTDESNADWVQVTIPTYASGSNWTWVNSGEISLDSYVGNKVKIAFKYISSTSNAATWEIKNVVVAEKVYTTEFSMDAAELSVEVGKSKSNNVTVNSGATITYASNNTSVATVAADGSVTGVAEGSTTITLHVDANGNYPAKDGSFAVTVTPATAEYVTLPWSYPTDWDDDELSATSAGLTGILGVEATGLGDYAAGNAPYQIKLDGTGDNIVITTDSAIGAVSIKYKMIGGANSSSITVKESEDGNEWSTVGTLSISGAQNSTGILTTDTAFDADSRYIQLYFNKGSNVGIGGIAVSKPSTNPTIVASNVTDFAAIGGNSSFSYTVNYFDDDVEVDGVTGCVSSANVSTAGTVSFTVAPNYTATAVSGTIVLQSHADNTITKTINVSQLGSSLSVNATEITIPASATTATFTVTSAQFGYNAAVASTESGMNLSISSGASGSANASAQTVTVSSNTSAPTSGDAITLGTISVYRNGNTDDPLIKTITVKKAVAGATTYTVTFPDDNSSNNGLTSNQYVSTWTAKSGTFSLSISNFNNNNWQNSWTFIKCGRKNNASVATIITDSAIPEAIKTVKITIDGLTVSRINSIKLYSGANGSSWTEEGSFTAETGEKSVTIASPTANRYYKLEFDCASGSSNGLLTLSKIVYTTN